MQVFAIRPEPGLSSTIAAGAARGLPIAGYPLSAVGPSGWTFPDLKSVDALLVGSANAIRFGGEKLESLLHLPVLAVGEATANAARDAGFSVAKTGAGGLQSLIDELGPNYRNLLRLAGEDHVPIELPEGMNLITRVVYRVQNTYISEDFAARLNNGAVVLLHSAGAAAHFASECDRLGLERDRIALAAIGPRVLSMVGSGWRDVRAAANPSDAELLALAQDMCQ
ncbi:MAG TPA: uroporphyrinogen-III synthase [Erythrobacter sp.]|nr:uroporphyrinogen-III synthase [Erythrobacter sp.]